MAQSAPISDSKFSTCKAITRLTLRILQFIFAVVVAGIYGADLAHATKHHEHAHAEWIYSEFVAIVSVLTCLGYILASRIHAAWATWDAVVMILWLAQVGVFGTIYTSHVEHEYVSATLSVPRMQAGVWIDLVNLLLWFTTTVFGVVWGVQERRLRRGGARRERKEEECARKESFDTEKGLIDDEGNEWPDCMKGKSSTTEKSDKAGLDEKEKTQGNV